MGTETYASVSETHIQGGGFPRGMQTDAGIMGQELCMIETLLLSNRDTSVIR